MLIRFLIRGALIGAIGAAVCTAVLGIAGYYVFIAALAVWFIYKIIKQYKES